MDDLSLQPVGDSYRSLSQHVYDVVLEAILDGRFAPGRRLGLDDLAAQLKVSPTPVRDALYRLASEGFVEAYGRRGFRVTVLSREDLAHFYDLRLMCELYAVDRGLANLTPEVLGTLETLAQETVAPSIASGLEERLAFVLKDREFHAEIVRLACNPRLSEMFVRLNTYIQVLRVLRSATADEMRAANGPEHMAIVATLRGGDAEAIKRAVRTHAESGLARVLVRMEAAPSDLAGGDTLPPRPLSTAAQTSSLMALST